MFEQVLRKWHNRERGAYKRTYLTALRQAEKDLPWRPSAANIWTGSSNISTFIYLHHSLYEHADMCQCLNIGPFQDRLPMFEFWCLNIGIQTLAAYLQTGIADNYVRLYAPEKKVNLNWKWFWKEKLLTVMGQMSSLHEP